MNHLVRIFQNKFARTATLLTLVIFILILILSPKKNAPQVSPNIESISSPRPELIELSREKRNQAMIYVEEIEPKLPIYLENFTTSVGITTTISIYRFDTDEAEVVRLEIYGLSYLNSDSDESKNPNVTAFKESYYKAIELLESKNINPKKLIFIYGDREYVRSAAAAWISAHKLSP